MKVSTWLFTASLLVATSAQEDGLTTTTMSVTNDSTSTTEAPTSLITLPPASCSSAGFESCYQVLELLTPTVYVILTADDPATIGDAEPITSGDPILTQTENIATASDEEVQAPITAVVAILYSESLGTTCDPATVTSVLANDGDSECIMATAPFFTPPDAVTKTRVIRKAREDESEGKGTETGGDGGQTSATAAPGSTTDENPAAVTTNDAAPTGGDDTPTEPAPTEPAPAPTTEDGSQPTQGPPDEPTEEPTGTNPTPTEDTSQETENPTDSSAPPFIDSTPSTPTETISTPTTNDSNDTPTDDLDTQTSGQESSRRAPTGQDESGKPEITTAFTTIAEVSGGTTKFLTSAVATLTRPASNPSASDGGSGAGSNFLVKAQVLFGAVGLAAVVGL